MDGDVFSHFVSSLAKQLDSIQKQGNPGIYCFEFEHYNKTTSYQNM